MKNKVFLLFAVLSLASTSPLRGIENLRISVVSNNVVLLWPSFTNETYIVQHRSTLETNTEWAFLTTNYPAMPGTNWTTFTHSNIVVFPPFCGGNEAPQGDSSPLSNSVNSQENNQSTKQDPVHDGPDDLPYPWNPQYQPKSKGIRKSTQMMTSSESSSSESSCPFVTNSIGFYRVVRTGISLWSITNGMTFSGNVRLRQPKWVLRLQRP